MASDAMNCDQIDGAALRSRAVLDCRWYIRLWCHYSATGLAATAIDYSSSSCAVDTKVVSVCKIRAPVGVQNKALKSLLRDLLEFTRALVHITVHAHRGSPALRSPKRKFWPKSVPKLCRQKASGSVVWTNRHPFVRDC